ASGAGAWAESAATTAPRAAGASAAGTAAPRLAAAAASPNRRIVFAKTAQGYRWELMRGPIPAIGPHQVLVHVRAVSINHDDLSELAPDPHAHLAGLGVGFDAAGVVVAVGGDVTRVRPGMRVSDSYFPQWLTGPPSARKLAATTRGVFADYIALDASAVIPVPKELSDVEAATLPLAAVTAFEATIGQHVLHPGSIVLIEGTGGVSTFAMQFAAAAGARIIQTSSSDSKLERTQKIARHGSINYRKNPEWSRRVLALTHGHGADLIVDVGGKKTLPQAVQSLAYGGCLAIVGGLTGYGGDVPALALIGKLAGARGIYVGSRADFLRMNAFIAAHHIRPVVSRVFPFRDFKQALAYLKSGQFIGKVVLRL
ncbi:MAG: zinc-dependent alcohol dehydrogenase family protein, partial [Steroidobacteraceae bacterium]